ncbi:MAG: DUF2085 domain-containing protein [Anaerolineales bacterium]|nr:DUF2085 domain-containing protein [Anaerolineales bacterium]MCB0017671.1 DUF2085 domain-containing protein [Anaerolineales bacterium]
MASTKKPVTGWQRSVVLGLDRFIYRVSKRWLLVFNIIVAIYVGLPLLAPVLMNAGATGPARAIYVAYSPFCHQMVTRSFFVGGDQYAYPRSLAGTNLTSFEETVKDVPEFAGINMSDDNWGQIFAIARTYLGNDEMGYKTALCQRDMAIYGFILLGGILYAILRRRFDIKPLPVWAFILIGMGPIGLDGFSQLFGYMSLSFADGSFWANLFGLLGVRESPPLIRSLTGAWFGLTLVWLAYPHVNEGMKQTTIELKEKLTKAGAL